MAVNEKIQQAERWLDKLKQAYPCQIEVQDNLSAFLSATNSIADHLLEDYNNKYSLSVPLTDDLYANKFEDKAKKQNNTNALAFILWYKQKIKLIESDPIGSVLTKKRHLDIHRTAQSPDHISISVNETLRLTDHATVMSFPADISKEEALRLTREQADKELEELAKKRKAEPKSDESTTKVDLYFQDLPNINVKDVCEKFLCLMKDLVLEARVNFP